jgi:hypothetical protein
MLYAVEMASPGILYLQSIMKIGTGIQAILRFCLSNWKGRCVRIIDVRDL